MKYNKRVLSILIVAALTAAAPIQVMAENPEFAHDEATWARLRDNVMEYDELQMLVEEYNPNYINNQVNYRDTKKNSDSETVRESLLSGVDDMYDQAESYRDQADQLLELADSLQGRSKQEIDGMLKSRGVSSVASLMSAYGAIASIAATTESKALSQQMSADSAYEDDETKRLQYLKNQEGLIVSAQTTFASYNQLKTSLGVMEKNIELLQKVYESTQSKVALGLSTQTDVLSAQKDVQSLQATYTQTQASLNATRQQLCIMTGWQYDAQPEIKEVPAADLNRILLMNPEVDQQQALDNNYDLKFNYRVYENMTSGSADYKNMERTIKNQRETITAAMKNLYNDVLQKKTALELADAALAAEASKMNAMESKRALGMISALEYLQAQANYLGKQIDRQTADIALFQAMETYDWAVKGYLSQ